MKTGWIVAALVGSIIVAALAPCAAQEPVRDFSQLNTRLRPGDTVWVTNAQGQEVKGKIQALAPDSLALKGDGTRSFAAGDVRLIIERERDSLANGALIGLAVGSVSMGVVCLAAGEEDWCVSAALVYGGVGAAIGVGIDALIPGKKILAYRAPGPSGGSHARLSIAPVITPRTKGVAVAFAF